MTDGDIDVQIIRLLRERTALIARKDDIVIELLRLKDVRDGGDESPEVLRRIRDLKEATRLIDNDLTQIRGELQALNAQKTPFQKRLYLALQKRAGDVADDAEGRTVKLAIALVMGALQDASDAESRVAEPTVGGPAS